MATLSARTCPARAAAAPAAPRKITGIARVPGTRAVGIVTPACDRGTGERLRSTGRPPSAARGGERTRAPRADVPGEHACPALAVKENSVADEA